MPTPRHSRLLAILAALSLAGCSSIASNDDSDPVTTALANSQLPLRLVPVNHTARYAFTISVEDVWAGGAPPNGKGGGGTCCLSDSRNWRQPLKVSWQWGYERDPVSKQITLPDEDHRALVYVPHPPTRLNRPNREQLPPHERMREEAYLCVIFRTLDTVELAFSGNRTGCLDK